MPELTPGRRAAGPHMPRADVSSLLPWANGEWPDLGTPDQSRYGRATSDPLGREGPGWHKGPSGLPTLTKGWAYDPKTCTTTRETETPK